jgi:uncharacterized tellurite resistance protein B-like protein
MNTTSMKVHESFNDFVLFLYVHMALSDGSLHHSEELVILDRLTKLFPQEGNPKKKFDQAVVAYKEADKTSLDEFIHHSFQHFNHVKFAQRYKIYTDMYDIMHADGKVADAEQVALNTLKRIIDLGASEPN